MYPIDCDRKIDEFMNKNIFTNLTWANYCGIRTTEHLYTEKQSPMPFCCLWFFTFLRQMLKTKNQFKQSWNYRNISLWKFMTPMNDCFNSNGFFFLSKFWICPFKSSMHANAYQMNEKNMSWANMKNNPITCPEKVWTTSMRMTRVYVRTWNGTLRE